jgi:hypothetical protein
MHIFCLYFRQFFGGGGGGGGFQFEFGRGGGAFQQQQQQQQIENLYDETAVIEMSGANFAVLVEGRDEPAVVRLHRFKIEIPNQ